MAEDRQIQLRRDSEADWRSNDPTLATGEPGFVANRNSLKIGDGSTVYTSLAALLPSGMILPFGGATAPDGFLDCDGSAVSRTTYADLFAAIGTTWGAGDGSTTFNLPDLRGHALRGTGTHGTEQDAEGNNYAGPSVGSYQDDRMQQITGDSGDASIRGDDPTWTGNGAIQAGAEISSSHGGSSNGSRLNFDSANSPNARTGDETRMANAGVLFVIKT
jgi:hypothetical protein